jgi:hypothetical protein
MIRGMLMMQLMLIDERMCFDLTFVVIHNWDWLVAVVYFD